MTIIARPLNKGETDLLTGNESKPLLIFDKDDNQVSTLHPPLDGWTHELLEQFDFYAVCEGWDAYLGDKSQWIGSSEV